MRRFLSSLIMGASLVIASLTWAGFTLSNTLLDPGTSERLADHLVEDPSVRQVIASRLADAIEAQVPTAVPISRNQYEEAADLAMDDPRVEAAIRDGIVQAHQNALAGVDEPVTLDASGIGEAARDAIVGLAPPLDAILPASPELGVELPNTGLAWLGTVKDMVDRFTALGFVISLIGLTASLAITDDRGAALRRMGRWAIGSAAFWLLVGLAMPYILEQVAPAAAVLVAAAIDVFFGAMITPALILAGIGAIVMATGYLWPSYDRRRPAAMVSRPGRRRGRDDAAAGNTGAPVGAPAPGHGGRTVSATFNPPGNPPGAGFPAGPPAAARAPGSDRTQAFPTITSRPAGPGVATATSPAPAGPAAGTGAPTGSDGPTTLGATTLGATGIGATRPAAAVPTAGTPGVPVPGPGGPPAATVDGPGLHWVEGIGYTETDLSPDGLPAPTSPDEAATHPVGGEGTPGRGEPPSQTDTRRIG
ncbi:MAG: hypothetical protein ACK5RL_07180 [Acidimicrobiales bacterium]